MEKEVAAPGDVRVINRLTRIARTLRRRQTDEERKLWARLRDRRLSGLKFRRQAPCGPYVVDFLCEAAWVVVELDGSQHAEPGHIEKDTGRTRVLNELGYDVLRYWNVDVKNNISGVLDEIVVTASARLAPSSAPSGHLLPVRAQHGSSVTGEGSEDSSPEGIEK